MFRNLAPVDLNVPKIHIHQEQQKSLLLIIEVLASNTTLWMTASVT